MAPRSIAIVIYSMYGHIAKLAEAEKKGIEEAGGSAVIYQIAETLPEDVLAKMHAPAKSDYPIVTPPDLLNHDAVLFGVATRYGGFTAQMKTFWDATGQMWAKGLYAGKLAGAFVSTSGPGGGQESAFYNIMSTFVHHGMIFLPLGYKDTVHLVSSMDEVHGGSPWGAGTFAGQGGVRNPSKLELDIASLQGKLFWEYAARTKFSEPATLE